MNRLLPAYERVLARPVLWLGLRLRLWGFVVFAAAALLWSPPAEAAPAVAAETHRAPLVVVRGLGPVPSARLRAACRTILERYPLRCEVQRSRTMFEIMEAWDKQREQLDARRGLEALFRSRTPDALVELNLTSVDIYEPGKPYVFGLASLTDRIALVSLARLGDKPGQRHKRIDKLVLHEVGHAMGLPHDDDPSCVMRQDPTVASLDTAPRRLCRRCHAELARRADRLARPGQIPLDRVRGHLARGEADHARSWVARALWGRQFDDQVLNAFALAFIEARQWNESISVLRYLVKQNPAFAEAHVNLAISYQMRARDGDRDKAIRHFERALQLRPRWQTVSAHLTALRSGSQSAQGPG